MSRRREASQRAGALATAVAVFVAGTYSLVSISAVEDGAPAPWPLLPVLLVLFVAALAGLGVVGVLLKGGVNAPAGRRPRPRLPAVAVPTPGAASSR